MNRSLASQQLDFARLENLPTNVLVQIFLQMTPQEANNVCQLSTRLRQFCQNPDLWATIAKRHFGTTREEFDNIPGRTALEKYRNILKYQQMAYRQFENLEQRELEESYGRNEQLERREREMEAYSRSHYEPLRYDIPLPARYRNIKPQTPDFQTAVNTGNLDDVVYWLWRAANGAAERGDWEIADYLRQYLQ
jgi:hypothetical protein